MNNLFKKHLYGTIGEAKISYRSTGKPFAAASSSRDAYDFLMGIWDEDTIEYTESFCVICLNRRNKIIAYRFIGHGGVSGVVADLKNIFQVALLTNSSAIIISHNHPSGNLKPSNQDIRLTRNAAEAGKVLDLPVLDHLIVTVDGYYSFADEGLL
jgi:DNA repair protein RadC